jgi:hypothetical protein
LALQFSDALLAEYGVEHEEQQRRFKSVTATTLYTSRYESPQPWLWEMRGGEWLKALPLPDRPLRPRSTPTGHQLPLFDHETVAAENA